MGEPNFEKQRLLDENNKLWEETMKKLNKCPVSEEWRYINFCRELCEERNKIMNS